MRILRTRAALFGGQADDRVDGVGHEPRHEETRERRLARPAQGSARPHGRERREAKPDGTE